MILLLLLFWLFQQKAADAYNQKNRKNFAIIKWKNSLFFVAKVRFWGENEILMQEFIMQESKNFIVLVMLWQGLRRAVNLFMQ